MNYHSLKTDSVDKKEKGEEEKQEVNLDEG